MVQRGDLTPQGQQPEGSRQVQHLGGQLLPPGVLKDSAILSIIPDSVRDYSYMRREDFTVGYFVKKLLDVQREVGRTLNAENEAGVLLKGRFGVEARELMPVPKGMTVVPISPQEQALYEDRAGSREAAACMGAPVSLEMWHTQGDGGDAFSGGKGRMPPSAKLDIEHLPMMARTFGYTGVAFHTWLDAHPDDIRALSLNLLMRDCKINSAFHGAFHGPIFARGAMSSEYREVRHLAKLLKQEGQLISMLGWDPATAIEEQLKGDLGQAKIDELREKNVVVDALKEVSAGRKNLDDALKTALTNAGVEKADAVVGKLLKTVVDKPGCAEVCDWDGTDGKAVMEAHTKPASLLGLGKGELKPSLAEYLHGVVSVDSEKPITRMDLLVQEKIERILMTGGLGVIKIEPKYQDPSEMTEADITAVLEVKSRVEQGIKDIFGAQILSENPAIPKKEYEQELAKRYKPYEGCITCQIEEGHSRQMPGRRASADVEIAIHEKALARAYHENWSPEATFLGDPDHPALVNPDMIRRHYVLLKAGLIGPDSDPQRRITTEFDMAPHFWDTVHGFQASREAVNVSVAIARNLIKIESMMQATGTLTPSEREIQDACGTLPKNQGTFQMGDTGRIFQVWSRAFAMPTEGLKHIPVAEDAEKFRHLIGRPYNIAKPTAEIERMVGDQLAVVT